ncbi:hypothetical protein FB451DRAFT_1518763 [Mycena latifolia]|nr:hypothetical protein FB451DRAFT_1518763 [Mycena latifolia]
MKRVRPGEPATKEGVLRKSARRAYSPPLSPHGKRDSVPKQMQRIIIQMYEKNQYRADRNAGWGGPVNKDQKYIRENRAWVHVNDLDPQLRSEISRVRRRADTNLAKGDLLVEFLRTGIQRAGRKLSARHGASKKVVMYEPSVRAAQPRGCERFRPPRALARRCDEAPGTGRAWGQRLRRCTLETRATQIGRGCITCICTAGSARIVYEASCARRHGPQGRCTSRGAESSLSVIIEDSNHWRKGGHTHGVSSGGRPRPDALLSIHAPEPSHEGIPEAGCRHGVLRSTVRFARAAVRGRAASRRRPLTLLLARIIHGKGDPRTHVASSSFAESSAGISREHWPGARVVSRGEWRTVPDSFHSKMPGPYAPRRTDLERITEVADGRGGRGVLRSRVQCGLERHRGGYGSRASRRPQTRCAEGGAQRRAYHALARCSAGTVHGALRTRASARIKARRGWCTASSESHMSVSTDNRATAEVRARTHVMWGISVEGLRIQDASHEESRTVRRRAKASLDAVETRREACGDGGGKRERVIFPSLPGLGTDDPTLGASHKPKRECATSGEMVWCALHRAYPKT